MIDIFHLKVRQSPSNRMRKSKYLILALTFAGLTCCYPASVSAGYNAIAFSRKSNIWGASYSLDTKKQARKEVLRKCRLRGGQKCKIVMWSNRCSALAISTSGRGGYGTGSGTSHDQTRQSAQKTCRKGNWICRTAVSTCEDEWDGAANLKHQYNIDPQGPLETLLNEAFCKWSPGDLN